MFSEKRILIFSGGNIGTWALAEIQPEDFLLGVDRGAAFLIRHQLQPDYVLGDFDSVTPEELESIKLRCENFSSFDPVQKDQTDTELGFEWALEQKPKEILVLGGLGSRFDHTLANVHLLRRGLAQGIASRIIDDRNEVQLIDGMTTVNKGRFTHISLLPLTAEVTGVTLTGFQYPLQQATLTIGTSWGISNVLLKETGTIKLESGQLLVIKSKD